MSDFKSCYDRLCEEVAEICRKCERPVESVRILAVSKTFPVEALQEAYDSGIRMFGENKIQELSGKVEQMPDDVEWHFIGHLQSNKAAKAVELAHWIHSVDSLKLLNKLERAAAEQGKCPKILIEVNSGEEAKSGVSYDELKALVEAASKCEHLELKGLMTMAPLCDDPARWQEAFGRLRASRDQLQAELQIDLPELSMGMTGDFPQAIAENSTLLRIGSRLFGNRNYAAI